MGLFYINIDDPDAGGTGHTVRVCRGRKVPTAFKVLFLKWCS